MKKLFKAPLLLSFAMLAALPLSACNSGGGEDEQVGGTKVVTVWVHKNESDDEGKIYKQLMNSFNNKNLKTSKGTTVRMSMSFYGATLETKINASLLTGGLPDVVAVDSSDIASKVYSGVLTSLDDNLTAEEKNSYVDSVISQGTIDNKLYALSAMEAPGGLYYNKAMLKEVGYTDADFGTLENPWSFKDVHEAQKKLKSANKPYQINLNAGFGTDGNMYFYSPLVYSAGATFGTDDHVAEALTSDKAVAGISQLEMFYKKNNSTDSWVYTGSSDIAFTSGEIPFQIHGPWDARKIKKQGGDIANNYGIMPYPVYEDENGVKSELFAAPCGSFCFGQTKDAKNKEAAAMVVKYLTGTDASRLLYNAIGTFPTHKSLLNEMDQFKSGPEKDLADYIQANEFTRPKMIKYPRLKDAYGQVLDYIKNMNLVSNYNLKAKIKEEMEKVDNARA